MFKVDEKGVYEIIGKKEDDLFGVMPAGIYNYKVKRFFGGQTEELIPIERYKNARLPKQGAFVEATKYFEKFFDEDYAEIRKEMGMVNKLNVIFNGKPGTGKTHLASVMAQEYVKSHNAIGIVLDTIDRVDFAALIDKIRVNDPNRMIVLILDELEKNDYDDLRSPRFLGFLDGTESRENVLTIGTTNEIDDFPNYLRNRKGRFEKFFDFEFEGNAEAIRDTAINLVPRIEDSPILERLVGKAIDEKIGTIDDLRFVVLDALYADKKGKQDEFFVPTELSEEVKVKAETETEKIGTKKNTEALALEEIHKHLRKLGYAYPNSGNKNCG